MGDVLKRPLGRWISKKEVIHPIVGLFNYALPTVQVEQRQMQGDDKRYYIHRRLPSLGYSPEGPEENYEKFVRGAILRTYIRFRISEIRRKKEMDVTEVSVLIKN